MKAFLDSTAGRTIIIAAIAAGTTVFAVPWDGAETVLRAAGGAFFGALAPLVFYLKKNADAAERYGLELSDGVSGEVIGTRKIDLKPGSTGGVYTSSENPNSYTVIANVTDFDEEYHFVKDGRHAGKLVDCADCRA